ncbi:MAG: hypothetical protein ACE5GJ_04630 [Gemmatimonadota bacterium]
MTPIPEAGETPPGLVDLSVAEANARRVAAYAGRHGLTWRPHIKTHKSREIAALQLAAASLPGVRFRGLMHRSLALEARGRGPWTPAPSRDDGPAQTT